MVRWLCSVKARWDASRGTIAISSFGITALHSGNGSGNRARFLECGQFGGRSNMTSQTKHFIELSDVVALRCECKECHASLLLQLPAQLSNTIQKCPNCYRPWVRTEEGDMLEPDVDRLLQALRQVESLQAALGCSLS